MKPVTGAQPEFRGLAGTYLSAVIEQRLLVALRANPANLEVFRDRDDPPLHNFFASAGRSGTPYAS